ncbi:MAG: PAS domain-containing sensor histidine kinase [Anaerovoracaceae bacterium]|jgi:PAS domain S-box-containing protein
MSMLYGFSMTSAISTTLVFGLIFLFLAKQNSRLYMILWGVCWIVYSVMFSLDFIYLSDFYNSVHYIAERQALSIIAALLFLAGTHRFFRLQLARDLYSVTLLCLFIILIATFSEELYDLIIIPAIMFSTGLLVWAGWIFISYSWTQNIPEKLIASFLIILWAIFSNHFAFSLYDIAIATFNYFIGLFMVNLLILFLLIIHFKKTRFLLMKSEQRYRLLVENSSDSMFLYDYKKEKFQYISPSVQPLLGISAAELYVSPQRFFEKIDMSNQNQELLNLFQRPIRSPSKALLCLKKDDQPYRWSEMHYLPIMDALGSTIAVEGILRDITERKQIEESLKASESARRELIDSISHELRTPITLIQGYVESMLDDVVPPSSVPLYLKMIHSKTQLLNMLLDDLIQISHFTSQTFDYKFYEHDACKFFSNIIAQAEFQVKRSGKNFVSENTIENNLIVILDPFRIEQVVANLINNSIRHTPAGGTITVQCMNRWEEGIKKGSSLEDSTLTIPEGEIIFTVTDTGEGIHPDDLPHLFERGFQGRNSSGNSKRNAGLGLFISMQIIKQHSGRIWAKNNSEGGAILSFSIPYYRSSS